MPSSYAETLPSNRKAAGSLVRTGILSGLGALLFLAWSAGAPMFRNADGSLGRSFCASLAVAAAGTLLVVARKWAICAGWTALALLGSCSALQLIHAGNLLHYQHYALDQFLQPDRAPFLVCFLLQAMLVAAGLRSKLQGRGGWVATKFGAWPLAAVLVTISAGAAAVSRDVRFYGLDLIFGSFVQVVNLGNIVLVVASAPAALLQKGNKIFDRWFGAAAVRQGTVEPGGIDRFCATVALAVTLSTALLSFFVYQNHPHVADEVSYLYQARYFADGKLFLPAPPVASAFDADLMTYEKDRWFSPVPPGWPAMLAVGSFFGVPWLVNPVLAGLSVLTSYVLLREFGPRRTARLCITLLALSPWFIFMSMNFMTHAASLFWALMAGVGVARARSTGKIRWGWMAGAAIGAGTLIRPLDGAIVALVVGAWAIGIGGRRLRFACLAAFALGTGVVSAVALPYNRALTGDAGRPPIMAYTDKYYGPERNAYGFGPNRGLGWALDPYPGHTFGESLINDNLNIFSVNVELLGWSTGSLVLIAALVFGGGARRLDWAMLGIIFAVLAAYTPYWFSGGPDFGARYWYLILVPCIVLTVRGIEFLQSRFDPARVGLAVACLCAVAAISYFPWRCIDKYYHYLTMRPDIRQLAERHHFGDGLVLVRGDRHPDYASVVIYNPLDLRARQPLYAWDRNPETRKRLLDAYPDRSVWLVNGPSITHGGFEVVAGPLAAPAVPVGEITR